MVNHTKRLLSVEGECKVTIMHCQAKNGSKMQPPKSVNEGHIPRVQLDVSEVCIEPDCKQNLSSRAN